MEDEAQYADKLMVNKLAPISLAKAAHMPGAQCQLCFHFFSLKPTNRST